MLERRRCYSHAFSGLLCPDNPAGELYHLEKTPYEMKNEYYNPAYKDVITDLKEELLKKHIELRKIDIQFQKIKKIIETHWNEQKKGVRIPVRNTADG